MAARLANVGQTLLTASPFAAVTPNFFVMSSPEMAVAHPDAFGVFVSEGMMAKCPTDDDLAAVVALELGAMIAEKRNLERLGLADPAAAFIAGDDPTASPIQDARAKVVSTVAARKSKAPPVSAEQIAKDLLIAAGYSEESLVRMAPLVLAARDKIDPSRTVGGPAAEPKWSR
jgi:predicted Zn-dependent protease